MSTDPPIVEQARELMAKHQSGSAELPELAARLMDKIIPVYTEAVADNDERTLEYCAPQIAALADRIGWLRAKK
jgi:hypothetical protein